MFIQALSIMNKLLHLATRHKFEFYLHVLTLIVWGGGNLQHGSLKAQLLKENLHTQYICKFKFFTLILYPVENI